MSSILSRTHLASVIRLASPSANPASKLRPHLSSSSNISSTAVHRKIPSSISDSPLTRTGPSKRTTMADTIVCIGDIHGHLIRLRSLWRNLELRLGPVFATATVIFLGDFCDRGPDTAGVLDFLISLPTRYPSQRHVFLCGNHDFGFSAFLGLLRAPDGFQFSRTWEVAKPGSEVAEGWFTGAGHEDMHLQGRRWGGRMKTRFNVKKNMEYRGSIFDAEPTFQSYGVVHGDREGLIKAVPETHKAFLRSLVWIHEQEGVPLFDDPTKSFSSLIAVHAGLETKEPLQQQLNILRDRDVTVARIEYLQGRKNVWETPEELVADKVLVVSGHHGALHFDRYRLIIDESGGSDHQPLAAIILPSRVIVRDTDALEKNHHLNTNAGVALPV